MVKVNFLPANKTVEVPVGNSILDAAILAKVKIESTCGGRGTCGKCKVLKRPLNFPEVKMETALACQSKLQEDTVVILKENQEVTDRKIALNTTREFKRNTGIKKLSLDVPQPNKENPSPDWERLCSILPYENIPFKRAIASSLPSILRESNHKVTAVLDSESLLTVEPGNTCHRSYGIAIDIGTTTIVVHLLDLNQGEVQASRAMTNPQNVYGADVISRITYAGQNPNQLEEIFQRVIVGLNELISQICKEQLINPKEIYRAVVVGNTTMAHLFLGIDPSYLAPAPFTPVFQREVEIEAGELGLEILSTGKVIVLPNVAGYVGSDTVGVMLSAGIDNLEGINLIIDIGTNGEIVLVGKGRILTCSTAAGPAFEGAEIRYGMRATVGAIEGVRIKNDVELDIIGNEKPEGICGSGLIDVVAEMVRVGIIDQTGRFQLKTEQLIKLPPSVANRVRNDEEGAKFILVWAKDTEIGEDIIITQKDIRELQLAKGAIAAGTKILLKKLQVKVEDIDYVMLAGAFGNYIKKESAQGMGLLPPIDLDRITTIGNAASEGAKMVLLSMEERARGVALATKAEHVELSIQQDFQNEFLMSLSLGNYF